MKQYLGPKKILRIYIDNQDKYKGEPLWEEILRYAKEEGMSGATVFKGVAGMGAHAVLRSFNVFVLSQELPIIIEIIDSQEKVMDFIDSIDFMVDEGMMTISDTTIIKYKHK